MDILVVNAALSKNGHGKGRKRLVTHKIYINNNKTYSYKAGLISPPHTYVVFFFIYIRLSRMLLEGRTKRVSAHCFFVVFFFKSHLKFY